MAPALVPQGLEAVMDAEKELGKLVVPFELVTPHDVTVKVCETEAGGGCTKFTGAEPSLNVTV